MMIDDDVPKEPPPTSIVISQKLDEGATSIAIYNALKEFCVLDSRYNMSFPQASQTVEANMCTLKEIAGIIMFNLRAKGSIDITLKDIEKEYPKKYIFSFG
jgi:hypothetical protein